MRIEFIGAPTSGKSTIHRILINAGLKEARRIVVEHPIETEFHRFIKDAYGRTTFERLPDKTLWSLDAARFADESEQRYVFDEGLMQCGVSMGIRLPEHEQHYFEHCPLPHLLVYLHTKESRLILRNQERGERSRPEKTIRAIECIKRVIPILESRGCNIIKLDTGRQSIIETANEVMQALG